MKIRVQCPQCKWNGSVDAKLENRKGKCPKCRVSFMLTSFIPNTDRDQTVEAKIEFVDGKIKVSPAHN